MKTNGSSIKNCPFCGIGLYDDEMGFYLHPLNECILDGFSVQNEKNAIERWNTRKTMEAIFKQLEFQAEVHNRRADEHIDKNVQLANHSRGKARSYEHALEIVKGF